MIQCRLEPGHGTKLELQLHLPGLDTPKLTSHRSRPDPRPLFLLLPQLLLSLWGAFLHGSFHAPPKRTEAKKRKEGFSSHSIILCFLPLIAILSSALTNNTYLGTHQTCDTALGGNSSGAGCAC